MTSRLLQQLAPIHTWLVEEHQTLYSIVAGSVLLYIAWRIWTFTIRPALKPHELPPLPYWVPFFGHAVGLFRNTGALYTRAHIHFGKTRRPYQVHVAGENIAVITHPAQIAHIFKDSVNYSFDPFIDNVYRGVGNVSEEAHPILWRTPREGFVSLFPNPKELVLVHTGNALLHKHLLGMPHMQNLIIKVVRHIDLLSRFDTLSKTMTLATSHDSRVISLHRWCLDTLVGAQTRSFFGEYLEEIEPNMLSIFDQWDLNSWMISYRYPAFMAKPATNPRDRLIKSLTTYLKSSREKRTGAIPFVEELEDEEKHAGLSVEDSARILMIILWGINSNVQMTAFWMMAYIIQRPSVADEIRREIAPMMNGLEANSAAESVLTEMTNGRFMMDKCPLLNSTFQEVIRVVSTGSSVREVMHPVHLDGKALPKGMKVLMPQRQLLLAPEAFGPDSEQFDPYRFIKNKSLVRHEYYRPFGGGVTLCSGRIVGKYEVLAFVVLTLWRYNLRFVKPGESELNIKGKPFPRLDEGKPSLGISKQVEGDDMIIHLTKRKL